MRASALMLVLGLMACGGGGDGAGSNSSGIYSCDVTSGASHSCVEYDWTGGDYPTSAWNGACTQASGSTGDGCTRSGAVGGCKLTTTAGAITVHTTSWFYMGDAASFMSACTQSGGTFVTP
jgi:hypothetical protein